MIFTRGSHAWADRSAMRRVLPAAILIGIASPAHAQAPRVSITIPGGDPGYPGCSTATIMNLERADGFLSVRAGPSARERELARLRNGDAVFACVRQGNWFGIVFERPGRRTGCNVDRAPRVPLPYTGPCRSGWVHYNYIGGYADWVSP